ncbi:MAG: hypothetical protein ABR905_01895 [Terracidiphilus sp.]|jgi:hypothetical protein
MAEASAFLLSKAFSQLTGRKVAFVQAPAVPESKMRQVYGIYLVKPHEVAIVVKADLLLMGSIAGALVGLPDPAVKEHLKIAPLEELMRDAILEVFNIGASTVTTEGRAVFSRMVMDPAYIDGPAEKAFKQPFRRSYFNVTVEGYQGGRFVILSDFIPVRLEAR